MLIEMSDTERPILHDITYMWNLRKKEEVELKKNRIEMWLPVVGGSENE